MNKIRKGDEVVVLVGKDRGRRGVVVSNLDNKRIVVEGVNIAKKHTRPNPMKGEVGGIVEKAMPIDISNVALFNPASQKSDRVGIKVLDDGKKARFFKSNGELVDV